MRCVWIIPVLLLGLSAASASPPLSSRESAVAAYISEPSATPYQLPYAVPPHGAYAVHNCPVIFLKVVAKLLYSGAAEMLFDVKRDGSVVGVIIAASSSNKDIDLMSAICVQRWQYEPAKESDKPVDVSWQSQIAWTQNGNRPEGNLPEIRLPATNCIRARPGAAEHAPPAQPTTIRYQLAGGEVTGAAVDKSSGDAPLDDYAAGCVKTWHFLPVLPSGHPATGSYSAVFYWQQKL